MFARLFAIAALTIAGLGATASVADERPEIRFARGAIDATLEGAVVRGDRDIYPINATGGQTMTIEIVGLEDNAVFQVYPPGTHYSRDMYDVWSFHGRPVRGTDGDTRQWSGRLNSGGQYLIVVGGTRGNADYRMNVQIE